jgi:hypothetical protein
MNDRVRLGWKGARYLYELTVFIDTGEPRLHPRFKIEVDANDRAHATRIAERAGYSVYDVNRIG